MGRQDTMRGVILGALALLTGGMAEAAPARLDQIYDLYLGGIKAGELEVTAEIGDADYRARSALRTAGIVGFVYKASFEAETEGRIGDDGYAPARFQADSRMRSKHQSVEMSYAGNAPDEVRAEPAFVPKPWQIEPSEQTGAFDPITGALLALAPAPVDRICNREVDVFDGRRRYVLVMGAPERDGDRIRCPTVYRRLAGFKPKMMKKQTDFPFDIWFEPRPGGMAQIVRAAGDTMFGLAVVLLRQD